MSDVMTSTVYSSLTWVRSHWERQWQSHINSVKIREQSGSQILPVISIFSMPVLSARTQATKKTLLSLGHVFGSSGSNEETRIRYCDFGPLDLGVVHLMSYWTAFKAQVALGDRGRSTKHIQNTWSYAALEWGPSVPIVENYEVKLQVCNVLYIGNFNSWLLECSITSDDMRRVAPGGADKTNDDCTCQDDESRDVGDKYSILFFDLCRLSVSCYGISNNTILASESQVAEDYPKIDQACFNLRSKLMDRHREILLHKSQIMWAGICTKFHRNLKFLYATAENRTGKRQWTRVNKTQNTKGGQKKQYGSVRAQLVVLVYSKVVTILQMQQYGSVKASLVVLVTCLFQSGNNTTDEVY